MECRPKLGFVRLVRPRPGEFADFLQFGHVSKLRLTEVVLGFWTRAGIGVVVVVDGAD